MNRGLSQKLHHHLFLSKHSVAINPSKLAKCSLSKNASKHSDRGCSIRGTCFHDRIVCDGRKRLANRCQCGGSAYALEQDVSWRRVGNGDIVYVG